MSEFVLSSLIPIFWEFRRPHGTYRPHAHNSYTHFIVLNLQYRRNVKECNVDEIWNLNEKYRFLYLYTNTVY